MTRVKICGITNVEDARAAADFGADAIGFILIPDSPRHVGGTSELFYSLRGQLPFLSFVGVCRLPTDLSTQFESFFDTAQFYEPLVEQHRAWYGEFKLIYASRVRDENSLEQLSRDLDEMTFPNGNCPVSALLLDTYHDEKLGGSGETFNWDLAVEAKARFQKPIILAGGLTPENVGEAIAKVQPYAVDVSSGVEAEPGRKDHAKLKAFIQAVHKADQSLDL